MKLYSPFDLRDVLAYDSYVGSNLTTFNRLHIHQHIGQGVGLGTQLLSKIKRIHKSIKETNWKAPEVRYKEQSHTAKIVLEIYNPKMEQWEIIKI